MNLKTPTKRRFGSRLCALVLALVLACSTIPFAGAVTQADIDALKEEKAAVQSQMNSVQAEIDELEAQEDSALAQALLYQQQMGLLTEQIADTEQIIADYEEQIQQTMADLAEAQQKEEEYYALFCERVRDLEESGTTSYWSIVFEAASFSDLLDRINFIADVVNYDNNVVEALEAARQAVADFEAQLEEEKAGQEAALAELESEQEDIQIASDKNDALIAEIRANEATYASQLAQLESERDSLADDIVASEAEYQAQIEAARRRAQEEEEARRRAEEAAAANQNNNNNNNNSNNGDDDDDDTPASTPSGGGSGGGGGSSGGSAPSSSIGGSVASYACNFIGGKYVWGGSDLSTGVDCSGFVQQVYAHFGVSLSHSSWAQSRVGTGVSASNAEPGDIVFYNSAGSPTGGHVGIYIGGGQIVSALNSKRGICVSNVPSGATYRRIG